MIKLNNNLIHRTASAALTTALCALLISGAAVNAASYRPGGDNSKDDSRNRPPEKSSTATVARGNSDSGRYHPNQSVSNDRTARNAKISDDRQSSYNKPGYTPRETVNYSDSKSRWNSDNRKSTYLPNTGKSSSYDRKTDYGQNSYRPADRTNNRTTDQRVVKPDNRSSYQTGNRQDYKPNDRSSNRPSQSSVSYRPDYKPARQTATVVYTHRVYNPPKSYRPPSFGNGFYHYSTPRHVRPCYYGYWTFDYYPEFSRKSVYFNFGIFPYIQITRIYEVDYTRPVYIDRPVYTDDGYYLSSYKHAALDDALSDIRSAWISGRFDLIENHVNSGDKIAVLLGNKYDYSIDSDDYLSMTHDALEDMQTNSFVWNRVRERSDGTYTAFGTHRYTDSSGSTKTVYVSYTLEKIGREYYIIEVGSGTSPLD